MGDVNRAKRRAYDRRRYAEQKWRKLYSLAEWKQARAEQFARMPWCERCWADGRGAVTATVVNHRRPHKGDLVLFLDRTNHESVCKPHHDRTIQSEERATLYQSDDEARRAYLQRRAKLLKVKGFVTG